MDLKKMCVLTDVPTTVMDPMALTWSRREMTSQEY